LDSVWEVSEKRHLRIHIRILPFSGTHK